MTDETTVTTETAEELLPGETPGENEAEDTGEATAPKTPGLSGHQRNRQLALEKYGDPNDERTTSGRNDFRLEFTNAEDRARATQELQGKARATKNGRTAIGGDRYLMWVKAQGFPDGMLHVVWPEERAQELEARRLEREEARAKAKAEKDAEKAAAKAAAAEEKAQKAAEKAAAAEADAAAPPKKAKKSKKAAADMDPAAEGEFTEA